MKKMRKYIIAINIVIEFIVMHAHVKHVNSYTFIIS